MLKLIIKTSKSIVIGMGLTVSEDVYKTVVYLLKNFKGKLIIDADALNSLAKYGIEALKDKKCEVLLTPHIKEFSRLCGKPVQHILNNQISLVKEFANKYSVSIILKNAVSVITNGSELYLNTKGSSGLAKAGSGDVLSGIVGGLAAQSNSLIDAAKGGAFILGLAGELAKFEVNEYSMIASDVISQIQSAISLIINE